ncbi:MAG: trypsin-like peptidase domain-containing protein [Lachnospiraceae bacterium]|nr:trypsin-like peptidase domain-containing protein [Lachnospiraceae bacterium]
MSNEYNYYTPESGPDYNYEQNQEPKKKEKKKMPKLIKVISLALVFGIVASVAFQATNLVADRFLGTTENREVKSVDNTKISQSTGETAKSDIASIAEEVMPSVVSITNLSVQQVQSFFGGIQEQESKSVGSGIIISQNDSELLIITNNHVVEGNETLTVSFVDEESVEAQVKGTDAAKDLAVIAVQTKEIKDTTMDQIKVAALGNSDQLQVGESVIAIGNALGYGQSVTSGIVSATGRELDGIDEKLIQTDAAINPGNSGGALLNANGEVVGINTAKVATDTVEGMGYAIPISSVSDIIENLMNQETKTKVSEAEQGQLGIQGVDVTADSSKMYNMPTGVYVSEVIAGGGAKKAGITKGSVITGINGTSIDGMQALKEQLQYYRAGETVKITVATPEKNGEYAKRDVEVTLGKKS